MDNPPIIFERLPDGTHELRCFGRIAGWAREAASVLNPNERIWRAMSVDGDIRHCRTRGAARAALLEMHHLRGAQ